ncbi:MAG: Gfo/Idh/MocA family oxidoreductase [Acidimicrobiia bacterium]|nr:Gfo/Idh/MocA family oxidoreductase [Acidimicrobiia bacterium]
MTEPLRIGTLGAAKITPSALFTPAKTVPEVEIVAIAARDRTRAEKVAAKHGIPTVHDSYDALLADPNVQAVYNPLPNGLHGRWTIAALEAGKHVLCEKPFTANAEEAERVAAVADRTGLVVMEAFHYRYHPLVARLLEIIASGELGEIQRIETRMCFPLPPFGPTGKDIRWQLDLAGGSLMDAGCYAVHQLRTLAAAEPEVVSAEMKCARPEVDRATRAELRFADGRTGSIETAMWSKRLLSLRGKVTASLGTMDIVNMTGPQYFHKVVVRTTDPRSGVKARRKEKVKGETTYWYQLKAFAAAVQEGAPYPTTPADAIANMRVIDAIYRAAGLHVREPSA